MSPSVDDGAGDGDERFNDGSIHHERIMFSDAVHHEQRRHRCVAPCDCLRHANTLRHALRTTPSAKTMAATVSMSQILPGGHAEVADRELVLVERDELRDAAVLVAD